MNVPTTPEGQKKFKLKAHSDGYKRIFDLGEEKVALLNSYLLADKPTREIIELLQGEWQVLQDVQYETLKRQLLRYKKDFVLPRQAQIASKLTNNAHVARLAAATAQIEAAVDVMSSMEWAVKLQLARVEKMAAVEGNLPTVQESQTKNLQLLMNMLNTLGQTQMDVGLMKKVPAKMAFSMDVSDEDRKYMESLRLQDMEAEATVQALRYLEREQIVVGEFKDVTDDE